MCITSLFYLGDIVTKHHLFFWLGGWFLWNDAICTPNNTTWLGEWVSNIPVNFCYYKYRKPVQGLVGWIWVGVRIWKPSALPIKLMLGTVFQWSDRTSWLLNCSGSLTIRALFSYSERNSDLSDLICHTN